MRIITGKNKGMKLHSPKGNDTRPTSDRVKESVFNILGNVYGSTVLDLFAGTGSIGLEFLSRGAKYCTFVEKDRSVSEILKLNIIKTKTKDQNYDMIVKDYALALELLKDKEYDYIYIDPPYYKENYYNNSLDMIMEYNIIKDGYIIIESDSKVDLNIDDRLDIIDQRCYKDTMITITRRMKV